jgi:hypothetical protein
MISTTFQHLAVQREPSSPNHLQIALMEATLLPPSRSFQWTFQRIQHTRSVLRTPLLHNHATPLLHIRATGPLHLTKTPMLYLRLRSGLFRLRVLRFSSHNLDCRILLRRAPPPLNVSQISGHRRCSYHRNRPCFLSRTDMSRLQRLHSSLLHKTAGTNRHISCLCPQKSSQNSIWSR